MPETYFIEIDQLKLESARTESWLAQSLQRLIKVESCCHTYVYKIQIFLSKFEFIVAKTIFEESYTFQLVLTLWCLERYLETYLMIPNSDISHGKT